MGDGTSCPRPFRFGMHGDVILKSDQELAIVDVLKEIAKLRGPRRTMIEESPARDSKSNGVAERAIQSMEKLIRQVCDRNANSGKSLRPSSAVCMVGEEFCADLHNRCHVGSDGETAHQRLKGKHSNQAVMEFGTSVMCKVCVEKYKDLFMGERLFHGIFLGKKAGTRKNTS